MLSPPLDMQEKWFAPYTGYAMAKFGMSLVVLGLAGELRGKVAVNALWPRTTIATAAIRNLLGGEAMMRASRKPEICGRRLSHLPQAEQLYGNFLIDDTFLAGEALPTSTNIASTPASRLQVDSLCPTPCRRPKASA